MRAYKIIAGMAGSTNNTRSWWKPAFLLGCAALLPGLAGAQTPFTPNDPYFFPGTDAGTAEGYYGQWYLKNDMPVSAVNAGQDVNIMPAWSEGYTGAGVVIQVIDDGVEATHPDLQANFSNQYSYSLNLTPEGNAALTGTGTDYSNYRGAPLVVGVGNSGNNHGTSVAGIAGAVGGNGIGITGAAPAAQIASINFLAGGGKPYTTDQNEALALLYQGQTDVNGNPDINAVYTGTVITETPVRVKNNSYGPSPGYNTTGTDATLILNALTQSAKIGVIDVFAAGNQRGEYTTQDSNTILESASPNQISVAALGSNGKYASYSDFGSNVMVTAPSNSFSPTGLFAQPSTDRVSGTSGYNYNPAEPEKYFTNTTSTGPNAATSYTSDFGGTSGAAPIIAGIMALGVQANPNLTVQMAKQILARTSVVVDSSETVVAPVSGTFQTSTQTGGWVTHTSGTTVVAGNAAGYNFNNNYGFGLADATAFTNMAAQVTSYQSASFSGSTVNVGTSFSGSTGNEIKMTYNVSAAMFADALPLEDVQITFSLSGLLSGTTGYNNGDGTGAGAILGDMEAWVISPDGTMDRLLMSDRNLINSGTNVANRAVDDSMTWTYLSNAYWGETVYGDWTIELFNDSQNSLDSGNMGTLDSYSFEADTGSITMVPEPSTWILLSIAAGAGVVFYMRRRRSRDGGPVAVNAGSHAC